MSHSLAIVVFGALASAAPLLAARADEVSDGRQLFLQYCASCHGPQGDGNGPVAKVVIPPPPDLRRLASRYGRPLPADRLAAYIDGRADVAAHGEREMPVWGERFSEAVPEDSHGEPIARRRVAALVAYIESLQAPQ